MSKNTWPLVLTRLFSNNIPTLFQSCWSFTAAWKSPCRAPDDMQGHWPPLPGLSSALLWAHPGRSVMLASLSPSGSSPSLLSLHRAGPRQCLLTPHVGLGTGRSGWPQSNSGINQSPWGGACTQDNSSLHRAAWVKALRDRKVPVKGNEMGLEQGKMWGGRVGGKNKVSSQTHCDQRK